ncbi:MAG: hypothetical protein RRA94_11445 [Bacteroidota bacterium]|nr:hypothetical protein [Bacteroidota bacterium]
MKTLLLACLLLLPLAACSDDDGGGTAPVTYFRLTITNKTANGYQLFQSPVPDRAGFIRTGYVLSNVNYRITQLEAGVAHTFRLVPDGGDAEDFLFEKIVTSDGPDQTWVVY